MKLEQVQKQLADFLVAHGVQAMAAWPEERRCGPEQPVVLVSLDKLDCGPAAMQDYLGQRLDEESGQWRDLYGRKAQMTLALDVLAGPKAGMQACRGVFAQVVQAFQTEKPAGLTVRSLTGEEPEYDEKEGLLRLRCRLECAGWLYCAGEEAGTFLDFILKGDVNT